jgi:hypothetical protein
MPKRKDEAKIKSLESHPLEGEFVAISYFSRNLEEYVNTYLVYKIVDGRAVEILDIPEIEGYSGDELDDDCFRGRFLDFVKINKPKRIFCLQNVKGEYLGINIYRDDWSEEDCADIRVTDTKLENTVLNSILKSCKIKIVNFDVQK